MIWRGIAIGVLISAPMGPVGILCIQRTLDKGRKAGLYTGMGAALSDLIYCLLTGFGLSFIEEFIERNSSVIQLAGSAVLIAFGVFLFRKNPASQLKRPLPTEVSAKKSILGGFLFTFSNPLILFLIIGLFARFNFLMPDIKFYHYIIGYISILGGALGWWWLVTTLINKVRSHFNIRSMYLINRIIGVIILIFAVVGIITSITALAKASPMTTPQIATSSTTADTDSHTAYEWKDVTDYYNTRRGFATLATDTSTGVSLNNTTTPLTLTIPIPSVGDFSFRTSLAYLNEKDPQWTFLLKNANISLSGQNNNINGDITLTIKEKGPLSDFNLKHHLEISVNILDSQTGKYLPLKDNTATYSNQVVETYRLHTTPSTWVIALKDKRLTLSGGYSSVDAIDIKPLTNIRIQSIGEIGFSIPAGGELHLFNASLSYQKKVVKNTRSAAKYTIDDINYLICNSDDPLEGYWEEFDYTLDQSQLRSGGQYRLAMLRAPDGYELYYISGATLNTDFWHPGDCKARLTATADPNVFDLTWYDADGIPFTQSPKARRDTPNTLLLHFPAQNSTLRLIHR